MKTQHMFIGLMLIGILSAFTVNHYSNKTSEGLKDAIGNWEFIADQSMVGFKIKNMWMMSVDGKIEGLKGNANIKDVLAKSSVQMTLNVKTIDTDSKKRDKHLKTDDYFASEEYPLIIYKATGIVKISGEYSYKLKGRLTIKDVTKELDVPFHFIGVANEIATFKGMAVVNRKDFHIDYGGMGMGDEATVTFTVKARKQ